jgi:hypothetical protein
MLTRKARVGLLIGAFACGGWSLFLFLWPSPLVHTGELSVDQAFNATRHFADWIEVNMFFLAGISLLIIVRCHKLRGE